MKTAAVCTTALAALCLIAFTRSTPQGSDARNADIDAVIGRGGYNLVCPIVTGNGVDFPTQIKRRLTMLETLLRGRDVSAWPAELRAERERNLDRLHAYRLRGEFPRNYDHPEQMLPCFIDRDGAICAVGYLVEQSAGRALAEDINSRYQYATVAQIHDARLGRWVERSGLTRAEVEAIQEPGGPLRPEDLDRPYQEPVIASQPSANAPAGGRVKTSPARSSRPQASAARGGAAQRAMTPLPARATTAPTKGAPNAQGSAIGR